MLSNAARLVQYEIEHPFDDEYVVPFKYWGKDQITAVLSFDDGSADQELVLDSDYSLTDPDDTGTLTKLSDWDHDAVRLTIYRTVDLTQETDYRNGETLDMDTLEQDLDYSAGRDQQIAETLTRTATWPITDPEGVSAGLPSLLLRASKFAAWNAEGEWIPADGYPGIPVAPCWAEVFDDTTLSDGLTTMGFSAFAQTLIDDADAAAALTTLGVSAFAQTLLDDADASTALSTLGVSTYAKTLLDDASAAAALTTLGVSAFAQTLLDDTTAPAARSTLSIQEGVHAVGDESYTVTDAERYTLYVFGTALTADRTLTLPTAADNSGRTLTVTKGDSSSYKVTVDGEGSEKIGIEGNALTFDLYAQGDRVTLMCNGTLWLVLETNGPLLSYIDQNDTAITSPSKGIWYNPTNHQLTIPAGVWDVQFDVVVREVVTTATYSLVSGCLSTTNNSATDLDLREDLYVNGFASGTLYLDGSFGRMKRLTITTATTYYLNIFCQTSTSGTVTSLTTKGGTMGSSRIIARRVG